VHDLVAEEADYEGADGDDQDSREAWNGRVDGVDELGADDGIYRGPADAGEDVEDGDYICQYWLSCFV
jgi:hypothetical protein